MKLLDSSFDAFINSKYNYTLQTKVKTGGHKRKVYEYV